MPTLTQDAVPTDPNELDFLRRVFQPAAPLASVKRKHHGSLLFQPCSGSCALSPAHTGCSATSRNGHVCDPETRALGHGYRSHSDEIGTKPRHGFQALQRLGVK